MSDVVRARLSSLFRFGFSNSRFSFSFSFRKKIISVSVLISVLVSVLWATSHQNDYNTYCTIKHTARKILHMSNGSAVSSYSNCQ